jgi:quercetin dioxygenase-like cupin family protein
MNKRNRSWSLGVAVALSASLAGVALAQSAEHSGQNVAEMKFGPVAGMPTCAKAAVQDGDPSSGPFIILAKLRGGCAIPWHFHSANEHVVLVSGTARMEMKDKKAMTLRPGGYSHLPSKHVHQVRCAKACSVLVVSDGKFDIHYVDPKGEEITPEAALEPLKETPAAMP